VFRSYQAHFVDVPVDADGMRIDVLEERLGELARRGIRPKFIYTVASFQNPAGVSMSADRRRRLVDVADRYGVPILEDAAYAELRFEGEPLPSLVSLNPDGVLFANTFSKIFGPGIRLGWIAAPPQVIGQLCQAKQGTDQCSSTLGQRMVYAYGKRGLIEPQIAASITLYRDKRDRTLSALSSLFPPGTEWTRPSGGFYLWVTLPEGVNTTSMLEWAIAQEKVAYVAGAPFYANGQGHNQFRLCYSFINTEKIEEGIRRLARVVEHHIERRYHTQYRKTV
jgi:2-aminoadipate transaminase